MVLEPHQREVVQVRGGQMLRLVAPVARYTRFVALSKHFLWILALASVGVVVWIASDNTSDGGSRIVFSGIKSKVPLINEMLSPHYQGVDAKNQPYTITAEKAVQKDAKTIVMYAIRADMTEAGGKWLALDAGSGELNTETKFMTLYDKVALFYEGGYEFRADFVDIDINKGNAQSEIPIEGQGPLGTLKADSFSLVDRGRVIRFNGSVVTTLYPNRP